MRYGLPDEEAHVRKGASLTAPPGRAQDGARLDVGGPVIAFFSFLSILAFIGLLVLVAASRIAAMLATDDSDEGEGRDAVSGAVPADDAGSYGFRDAWSGYWSILKAQFRAIFRRPQAIAATASRSRARWALGLLAFFVVLQALRAILTLLRFLGWWTLVSPFDLQASWLGHFFEYVSYFEGLLAVFAMTALFFVAILGFAMAWEARPFSEWLAMLVGLDATRSAPAGADAALVHRFAEDLRAWRAPTRANHEHKLRDSLVQYLWDKDYAPTPEHVVKSAAGRTRRIDVIVNESLAVEIKRRLGSLPETDRAVTQLRSYAEIWSGRGTVVAVVVEPDRRNLDELRRRVGEHNGATGAGAPILLLDHPGHVAR